MPSLTPKTIHRHTYYYVRQCQRVRGHPKIVRTLYLGSLDHIIQAVTAARTPLCPQTARPTSFGDVAALWDQAQQLDLIGLIDAQLPKREQGLSVGQYLVLAALNRAAHPTSKAQLADWYHGTVLPRWLPATPEQLSSQAFWNHMERVQEADIQAIEGQLSRRLVTQLGLNLRTLVYDGTNFFTFINTRTAATLPARGHNKQHRGDLRQVSLGMLVSTDFHVPLFHQVYRGNLTDATAFQTVSEELAQRYRLLAQGCQHITLIFDKGNNSAEAFATLEASPFHFIGSLVPSQHPDLLAIALDRFHGLPGPRLAGCLAYRTTQTVFGQTRTVVVTFNEHLLEGQLQGLQANLTKARTKLDELQASLRRRREGRLRQGRAPTFESVRKQVEQILAPQFLKSLLRCQVLPAKVPQLSYRTDTAALARLVRTHLGKTILFTDNDAWSDEEIVLGYRAQSHIESAFRDMKNPHFLGWSPMFHWTDTKIRVHAFYCVLALTLISLLQRRLHQQGLDLSLTRLMEALGRMQEVLLVYPLGPGQKHPRTATCPTPRDAEQEKIFQALELSRYLQV